MSDWLPPEELKLIDADWAGHEMCYRFAGPISERTDQVSWEGQSDST